MKVCAKCGVDKELVDFGKQKRRADGYFPHCKLCVSLSNLKYKQSKVGVIAQMYARQKSSSKSRGHISPTYSKLELTEWLLSQKKFKKLYKKWKKSGYVSSLKPSVDRKKDNIGYTLNNIQLMSWGDNKSKGYMDRVHGNSIVHHKTTMQYCMDMNFIAEYVSVSEASRETGVASSGISACCRGDYTSSGGFKWSYKNV